MDKLKRHFNSEHKIMEIKNIFQWEERLAHLKTIKRLEYVIIMCIGLLFGFIFFENKDHLTIVLVSYIIITIFYGKFFQRMINEHLTTLNRFLVLEKLSKKNIEVKGILDYDEELENLPVNKDNNHIYLSDKLENIYHVLINHKIVPYTFILFKKFYNEIKHCRVYKNIKPKSKKYIQTNLELGYKMVKNGEELYMYQISNQLRIDNKTINEGNLLNGFIFLREKPESLSGYDRAYYINETYYKNEDDFERKDTTKKYYQKVYNKHTKDSKTDNIDVKEIDFDGFDKNELRFQDGEATIKGGLDITVNSFSKLPEDIRKIVEEQNFLMIEISQNHLMCYYEIDRDKELYYGYDHSISLNDNKNITTMEVTKNIELIDSIFSMK